MGRTAWDRRQSAGFVDEHGAAALGMAGGSPRRQGTRVLQVRTAFMTSLDVKTAFDETKPSAVSIILTRARGGSLAG